MARIVGLGCGFAPPRVGSVGLTNHTSHDLYRQRSPPAKETGLPGKDAKSLSGGAGGKAPCEAAEQPNPGFGGEAPNSYL